MRGMRRPDPTPAPPRKHEADYDLDFFAWTQHTAALLREGRFDELDVEHLAEEVEDMGKRERRELDRGDAQRSARPPRGGQPPVTWMPRSGQ
jgi:hypothetical protein